MKNIIGFSQFINVRAGGAEISTFQILKKKFQKGNQIKIISFQDPSNKRLKWNFMKFPTDWKLEIIKVKYTFNIFNYFEYLLNRKKVSNYFSLRNESICLITYGKYAPAAIKNFLGTSELYFRSEDDLGINRNYHTGLKMLIKGILIFLDYPALLVYRRDLKIALKKSKIFCNSKFMQQKLMKLYGFKSELIYPYVDKKRLLNEFNKENSEKRIRGIVFIDGYVSKGGRTAVKVAKKIDSELFYFFSKKIKRKTQKNNIIFLPWANSTGKVFSYAKIVIVPSIWEEAFGRVAKESKLLNIPVLVSNIGGLPESVDYDDDSIIKDFKNVDTWVKRIRKKLN